MERNKNLSPVTKNCLGCHKQFQTVDRRNNTCSPKCKYAITSKTIMAEYGVSNPNQIPKSEIRVQEISRTKSKASTAMWSNINIIKTRNINNIKKYGTSCTFNISESIENRVSSLEETYGTRSARLVPILKNNGFNSYQDFSKAIVCLIETSKLNPFSESFKLVLKDKFDVSTEVIDDALKDQNRLDLVHKFKSSGESEIYEFVKSMNFECEANTRPTFMEGRELDILIPSQNLAIEFHGLVHHSLRPVFGPKDYSKIQNQHLIKYKLCKVNGIKLIQIFEDEWRDKRSIIESVLTSKLGKSPKVVYARNCKIKELESSVSKDFFNKNHVSGYTGAKYRYGLYENDVLVSAISFRSTWNKSYGERVIEIARFASSLNTQVVGGFQKLLKHGTSVLKSYGYEKILTYADCRFGSGDVYLKAEFEHLGHTGSNYFYEKNGIREHRFKHRKDNTKLGTERDQNELQGWYAIYDAGSEIYLKSI